jgi:hypothetical protein
LAEFAVDFVKGLGKISHHTSRGRLIGEGKQQFVRATVFVIKYGTNDVRDKFGKHVIKSMDLFSAFVNAIVSISEPVLLQYVLNKCLLQYSIASPHTSVPLWTVRKHNEPDILPVPSLHVQKVFELCPNVFQMVDSRKRLPLHCAVASGSTSFEVVMEVFTAYKHAASIRDPVTGLFPFQLAASTGNYKASYSLLLENPSLVATAPVVNVSDRKRKRSTPAPALNDNLPS